MRGLTTTLLLATLLACGRHGEIASRIHVEVAAELTHTRAIDNHAHPRRMTEAGEQDRDFDALPADAIQQPAMPSAARPDNPYYVAAWQELFAFRDEGNVNPETPMPALAQAKQAVMRKHGDFYPTWILNQVNTETMLANRVTMGKSLPNDRFKWVPFVDMFLFPLNNDQFKQRDVEHDSFVRNEEKLLAGYLERADLKAPPLSFEDYLTFISHSLEKMKSDGAVALKFEFAYLRDLQIGNPSKENAERVYAVYVNAVEPSAEEYKTLQDYLFRYVAGEAGRLALPVHIHSSLGVGSYFRAANANPLAMEDLFNDPLLRRTKFVMLHGAWPFTREAAALILKPNVYVDYSAYSYLTYPAQAAQDLRLLLEAAPNKVLYGSDASPFSANVGWEETAWAGAKFGRETLGLAVSSMIDDGEISTDRGKQLVHMVLRENARQLYGW